MVAFFRENCKHYTFVRFFSEFFYSKLTIKQDIDTFVVIILLFSFFPIFKYMAILQLCLLLINMGRLTGDVNTKGKVLEVVSIADYTSAPRVKFEK